MSKKLMRKSDDRMVFGVASGIADYLNIDPVIVRLLFVLMALTGGHGILVYLILTIIMPEEGAPVGKAHVFDEEEIVIKEA
ncbi:MAG: PspC domain-containing protein [Ardenticatenaceae bacterium]|nr:PspC domain-containing protein [Ardenticatenaceae bacterium]MCB9443050.1 PspC domain-containing protein [Ardenticatenaceae bacterium]